MLEIRKTHEFAEWLDGLGDVRARARILVRIERLATGNPGDVKAVGEGVSEGDQDGKNNHDSVRCCRTSSHP